MDIKTRDKLESLEDIALDYAYILIDNCAFQGIPVYLGVKSIKERLRHYQIQKSLEFWKKNLKYYRNCYTIQEVTEELKDVKPYHYKETIKKSNSKKPVLLELRRTIRDVNKKRNHLIEYLEDEKRILEFDKEEQILYEEFYKKYREVETHYNLHGADYPLMISEIVVARTRGSSDKPEK